MTATGIMTTEMMTTGMMTTYDTATPAYAATRVHISPAPAAPSTLAAQPGPTDLATQPAPVNIAPPPAAPRRNRSVER